MRSSAEADCGAAKGLDCPGRHQQDRLMSLPKKAAFYAILALIVVAASELASSAFLFFAYQRPDRQPVRRALHALDRSGPAPGSSTGWFPGSAPDPVAYRRMARIPQDFFAEDAEQGYRAKPGRYIFRYTRRHGRCPRASRQCGHHQG